MITMPLIGRVAKLGPGRSKLCCFSQAKYGAQTANDAQWFPDAGNGIRVGGGVIVADPDDASVACDPPFQRGWIEHLIARWGSERPRWWILDNEPGLWNSTHRALHPQGVTMDELRDRMVAYATMITAADPAAMTAGPEEWGWTNYLYSGADAQWAATHGWSGLPDRAAHGGQDVMPWLLGELKSASDAAGRRLLHAFTLHYYPQGGEFSDDVSTAMRLRRNRSTRSLWDPDYVDESWIADRVRLIPRMKAWVADRFPGTQIGITEYNWGAEGHLSGATAQADVFGILGREGVDLAARWTTPAAGTPTYAAMKLWRNYDGARSGFGATSVRAQAPDPDTLSAFAALRDDGALTVMVVHKRLSGATALDLALLGFTPGAQAQVWQVAGSSIERRADVPLAGARLAATLPGPSVTLFVIPAADHSDPVVPPAGGGGGSTGGGSGTGGGGGGCGSGGMAVLSASLALALALHATRIRPAPRQSTTTGMR